MAPTPPERSPTARAMSSSDIKGICRNVLGGEHGTLRQVFENLERPDSGFARREDPFWRVRHWWVPLPAHEGHGGWDLLSIGEGLYAIITRCEYFTQRSGPVPAEGLIGLHFILDGPVELTGTSDQAKALLPVTMLASHQAPGVSFAVSFPAGVSRMLTICVAPQLLTDSFGLPVRGARAARRLLEPAQGAISTIEATMPADCAALIEDLLGLDFARAGSLSRAVALLARIIGRGVDMLATDGPEPLSGSYSLKDLRLLERAREALAGDLERPLSLADVARQLGTNQTKLKSGLRAIYGITASGYRRQCRMQKALRLLAEDGLPASVVAARVGYGAHASFTVAFQAFHNMTPREAQRQRKGAQPPETAASRPATP